LVVSCTGASEVVLTREHFTASEVGYDGAFVPRVVIDLALPRDVDLLVGELPGHVVVDLERISQAQAARGPGDESVADAVRGLIAVELRGYVAAQKAAAVAPTVMALREMAAGVVDAELSRFDARLADLDDRTRAEVAQTVRRVVEKLLHEPTVRVKALAVEPGGASYAMALSALFNLDPAAAAAVGQVDADVAEREEW
jgi:glutamyl-tRNA reductase